MAKIEKLKKDVEGVSTTIYPVTIPQAVIDPTSGKSVRAELDEKANHGYESNPKTLKQVDENLAQLAGDVNELELKDAVQGAKIKDIENVLSTANLNQSAQLSVSGRKVVSLPKNASNGGMSVKLEGLTATNLVSGKAIANGSSVTFNTIASNKYYLSNKTIITGDGNIYTFTNSTGAVADLWAVNLTATFGVGNEPDVATCDKIFSNYFEGRKNFVPTGRIRSVGKNIARVPKNRIILGGLEAYADGNSIVIKGTTGGGGVAIRLTDIIKGGYGVEAFETLFSGNTIGGAGSYVVTISRTGTGGAIYAYRDNAYLQLAMGVNPITVVSSLSGVGFFVGVATSVDTRITIQIERGTVASAIETYRDTNLYLTAPELRSNGLVKDEIRKGANGYELVKRISDDKQIASAMAISLTTTLTNVDLVLLNIKGTFDNVKAIDGYLGWIKIKGSFEVTIANRDNVSSVGGFHVGTGSQSGNVYFIVAKNKYANLDAAKAGLISDYALSTLYYELATPVITPISHGGILNSAENGTVYHEPIIADAGVYSTNMPILLPDYPISALEEIIIHKDGIDTYLDVSTAVIASDKLSFTHPSLVSGDLVLFTYAYNKETTNGNITATFYDSNVVKIDTVTGKAYKINEVVTNGVLTRTLTEV